MLRSSLANRPVYALTELALTGLQQKQALRQEYARGSALWWFANTFEFEAREKHFGKTKKDLTFVFI